MNNDILYNISIFIDCEDLINEYVYINRSCYIMINKKQVSMKNIIQKISIKKPFAINKKTEFIL